MHEHDYENEWNISYFLRLRSEDPIGKASEQWYLLYRFPLAYVDNQYIW